MFYRPKQQLKAQLEERLRTALGFATLGAYERAPGAAPSAPRPPQQRVFLFAKVPPSCPHGGDPRGTCDAREAAAEPLLHRGSTIATRRRSRQARRGGAAKPPPQPCTWAGGHS